VPGEETNSLELIDDSVMWIQKQFSLPAKSRGFHLITREVLERLPEIEQLRVGLLHLFIQHTSASLTINENADPDVRMDMETVFNHLAPEKGLPLVHTTEGSDDMPAHVKSSLLGASTSIPISSGQLALGTWQGIYLCEHRNHGGPRCFVATISGEQNVQTAHSGNTTSRNK
jgi:secondary thiamine-phosphate synthase enzyme